MLKCREDDRGVAGGYGEFGGLEQSSEQETCTMSWKQGQGGGADGEGRDLGEG